jgi:hypothetical protein
MSIDACGLAFEFLLAKVAYPWLEDITVNKFIPTDQAIVSVFRH